MTEIRIGTSGWSYDHWSGPFYPADLSHGDWLAYYAHRFDTVEINNSFYRLPSEHTLAQWRDTVADDFRFAVKASRYITHMKKLNDADETVPPFLERVRTLGATLGPVLFQLPPRWRCNSERLAGFLERLPDGPRYAFEFRDTSWFDSPVLEVLQRFNAAFCIYELAGTCSPHAVTADFVYIRLHGPGEAYQGSYPDRTLREWADRLRGWRDDGLDVYCYFDNDEAGYAAANAARLRELAGVGGHGQ